MYSPLLVFNVLKIQCGFFYIEIHVDKEIVISEKYWRWNTLLYMGVKFAKVPLLNDLQAQKCDGGYGKEC